MRRTLALTILTAGMLVVAPVAGGTEPVRILDGGKLIPEFLWSGDAVERMLDDLAVSTSTETPPLEAGGVEYLQPGESGYKSPGRAFFLSLLIPGTGELYSGSKRGLAFLGLEIISWAGYLHFDNKGEDERVHYQAFADLHYDRDHYKDVVNEICGKYTDDDPSWPCSECEYEHCAEDLGSYEGYSESQCEMVRGHFILPEENGQHYYEDLGKYDKYIFGWDDWYEAYVPSRNVILWTTWKPGEPWPTTVDPWNETIGMRSDYREDYREMRRKSNDYLDRATYFTWLVLVNHVASALDAAFTARTHNRRLAGEPSAIDVGLDARPLENDMETRIFLRKRF